MFDADALQYISSASSLSALLSSVANTIDTEHGSFSLKRCCAVTGSHAFAGRLIAHPRTLELREHVQVRGPATRLDGALNAFAEHICASAVTVHASKEHFVVDLEVFTGDGDAFDDEASAESTDGRATSSCRGTPERFGIGEIHARTPALVRALQAAVLAQLPIFLNLLVCLPARALDTADVLPPRWQVTTACTRVPLLMATFS